MAPPPGHSPVDTPGTSRTSCSTQGRPAPWGRCWPGVPSWPWPPSSPPRRHWRGGWTRPASPRGPSSGPRRPASFRRGSGSGGGAGSLPPPPSSPSSPTPAGPRRAGGGAGGSPPCPCSSDPPWSRARGGAPRCPFPSITSPGTARSTFFIRLPTVRACTPAACTRGWPLRSSPRWSRPGARPTRPPERAARAARRAVSGSVRRPAPRDPGP